MPDLVGTGAYYELVFRILKMARRLRLYPIKKSSHAFLRDVALESYNKDLFSSFNRKKKTFPFYLSPQEHSSAANLEFGISHPLLE